MSEYPYRIRDNVLKDIWLYQHKDKAAALKHAADLTESHKGCGLGLNKPFPVFEEMPNGSLQEVLP